MVKRLSLIGLVLPALFLLIFLLSRNNEATAPIPLPDRNSVTSEVGTVIPEDFDWADTPGKQRLLEKVESLEGWGDEILLEEGESLVTSGIMNDDGTFIFHMFTPERVDGGIKVTMKRREIDLSGSETEHAENEVTLTPGDIQLFTSMRRKEAVSVSLRARDADDSGKIALGVTESFRAYQNQKE